MVKKFILLTIIILSFLTINVNAAESITYRWINSMWGDSGTQIYYGNGIGYTQDAIYTNQNNTKRVSFYFNSNGSLSGGGVNIPSGTKYALLRFTMTTPSSLVTANYTSEFYLYNNWGGGQNCEVVSDFHNEINDVTGGDPDSGMLMRSIVLKCYLDNNATSLSGFAYHFTFAPYMATTSITIKSFLSGDIAFLYEETSMTDLETAINTIQITETQTQQLTEDIKDTLNDDTSVSNNDLEDTLDDWNDSLSNENALSDFILMPFTILNNISTGLSSRCEQFNLGSLLGHNIILPCIDIEDYLGTNLWSTIDSLFCLFMIYNIAMLFIQCFEGITTLRDDFDSLYTPQHGDFGYRPRHGSD